MALGASSNWMCNFIVSQVTPIMLEKLKYGTFIFFGTLTFSGGLFVWLRVPETKRLTLEEMDMIFGSIGVAEAVSIVSSSDRLVCFFKPGEKLLIDVFKDARRMAEINKEIGLDEVLKSIGIVTPSTDKQSQVPTNEIDFVRKHE